MRDMLTNNQQVALHELVLRLREAGIDFIIIGGLAAIAWGAKRPLVDIDIQVSKEGFQNAQEIFSIETKTPARHYQTENWDIKQMIIELNGTTIDICQAEDAYLVRDSERLPIPNCLANPAMHDFDEVKLPIMPLDTLIEYKQRLSRAVDIEDLAWLN